MKYSFWATCCAGVFVSSLSGCTGVLEEKSRLGPYGNDGTTVLRPPQAGLQLGMILDDKGRPKFSGCVTGDVHGPFPSATQYDYLGTLNEDAGFTAQFLQAFGLKLRAEYQQHIRVRFEEAEELSLLNVRQRFDSLECNMTIEVKQKSTELKFLSKLRRVKKISVIGGEGSGAGISVGYSPDIRNAFEAQPDLSSGDSLETIARARTGAEVTFSGNRRELYAYQAQGVFFSAGTDSFRPTEALETITCPVATDAMCDKEAFGFRFLVQDKKFSLKTGTVYSIRIQHNRLVQGDRLLSKELDASSGEAGLYPYPSGYIVLHPEKAANDSAVNIRITHVVYEAPKLQ